ncbi:MAG: CarD family transcriptional regulator [Actinomycetes bacterium]
MEFAPGTKVIHPAHGLTTVTERTEREVAGVERTYLVLSRPQDDLVLHVPLDGEADADLRGVIGADDVPGVMDELRAEPAALDANWRGLRAKNDARLHAGDVHGIAAVVRDLTVRRELRDRGLSVSEHRTLDRAMQRLCTELDAALEDDADPRELVDGVLAEVVEARTAAPADTAEAA